MERRRCEPLVIVVDDGALAVEQHQKEQHGAGMLDDEQAAGAIIKGRGTEPGDEPGTAGVAP